MSDQVDLATYQALATLRAENADLRATVERLTRERDEARADADRQREASHALLKRMHVALCGYDPGDGVVWLDSIVVAADAMRARLAKAERVRDDHARTVLACADAAEGVRRQRDSARRWSRLWHAEARRLWAAIHGPGTEVDPEEFMREIGGDQ